MKLRFRFEKLTVWQEARKLNREMYRLSRSFPEREAFGLTSQLRRASVSVAANIAEGSGRNSDKDFAHFLEQAYGSLMEVATLLHLSLDEGYLKEPDAERLLDMIEVLAKQLAALNRSLAVKTTKTPFPRRAPPALDPRRSTLDQ